MRKICLCFLAVMLCIAVLALAGCIPDNGNSTGGNGNTGGNENGGSSDTKSEQVTKSEWQNAFSADSFKNYTVTVAENSNKASDSGSTFLRKYVASAQSTLVYEKTVVKSDTANTSYEYYYEHIDNTTFEYSKNSNDEWIKAEVSSIPSNEIGLYWSILADEYGKIQFNKDKNAYYATDYTLSFTDEATDNENQLTLNSVTLKFTNKRVSYIKYEMPIYQDSEQGTERADSASSIMTIELSFYDYGATSITLPEAVEDENNGEQSGIVTEQQWQQAFSESSFSNVIINGDQITEYHTSTNSETVVVHGTLLQKLDITESHDYRYLYQTSESDEVSQVSELYTSATDGITTRYSKQGDGSWVVTTHDYEVINISTFYESMTNLYSQASYDSENKQYYIANCNFGPMTANHAYFKFDKNGKCTYMKLVVEDGVLGTDAIGNMTSVYNFEYGTVSITLPQIV